MLKHRMLKHRKLAHRTLKPWRRLPAARGALAGIEFALVFPLLLGMLAGVVDLSLAFITERRLTVAAADVALIASTMAVQADSLNALNGTQAWQATTAPFALFPAWRTTGTNNDFSITLSAVDFAATPTGYVATTRWSVGNSAGQIKLRPCGTLAPVPDGNPSDMATLPAGVFGATSMLVGDVSTDFVPLFTNALVRVFVGPVTMLRSAYVPPRVNNGVELTGSGPGQAVTCPSQPNPSQPGPTQPGQGS